MLATRACRVSQKGHPWCSTSASVCDDGRARFSQDDFRPILEDGYCRSTSSVHYPTVTATTTHHHCHVQTKMTIDSNHWHSSLSNLTTWHVCLIPPVLLLSLIIRKVRLSPPFLLLLKISSSRTCPRTVRLVIFTTDLHRVVSLRQYVETVAPLPTVDLMAVIVVATSVTRQYLTRRAKLVTSK